MSNSDRRAAATTAGGDIKELMLKSLGGEMAMRVDKHVNRATTLSRLGRINFAAIRLMLCVMVSGGLLLSAQADQKKTSSAVAGGKQSGGAETNRLSAAEKAAGWELLFDGRTTEHWRGAYQEEFPKTGWAVEGGVLKRLAAQGRESQSGGDIITKKQYSNFELQLEWRATPGANSGIKYFVVERMPKPQGSAIGLEMQILDDDRHPDAKMGRNQNRTAGGLYDLIPPQNKVLRPVGEFNHARIVVRGNHVEHWLNGVKVVEYERGSPKFRALVAESKYKDMPGFGEAPQGHILLQDHGDEVWFRNIKVRELTAAQ